MRVHISNWSLFLAVAVTATSVATTGCKSMPGWGSMAKKDTSSAGSSALAANAGEAPRYSAPPSTTSTPMPPSTQLAARNQITPNYLSGATPSASPYQQASTGAAGMQPQRGFYPQSPTGTPASSAYAGESGYASAPPAATSQYASQYAGGQQGAYPTQPSNTGYGMPGSTSTMPAAYTASAPNGTTYGSGSTAPIGYSPAPQSYTQGAASTNPTTGPSSYSGGATPQQGSVYGGSSYGGGSTPASYPSTSTTPNYPSTSTGSSAYPSTGAGSAYPSTGGMSQYPSTSNYSTTPAPNPNDYQPMSSPSYQTASAASAGGSHYRPGGTADYTGSGETSGPTTSRYGSTDYPASTYTR